MGRSVARILSELDLDFLKFPNFKEFTIEEMRSVPLDDRIIAINCSGRVNQCDSNELSLLHANFETVVKIVEAFASKLGQFIHISTSNIDTHGNTTDYISSKIAAESYVADAAYKYNFHSQILRLPTLWSKYDLKQFSLLDSIIKTQRDIIDFIPAYPDQQIRVTTEDSFMGTLSNIIHSVNTDLNFNQTNSWSGRVGQLCELLKFGPSCELDAYINKLYEVYSFWLNKTTLGDGR